VVAHQPRRLRARAETRRPIGAREVGAAQEADFRIEGLADLEHFGIEAVAIRRPVELAEIAFVVSGDVRRVGPRVVTAQGHVLVETECGIDAVGFAAHGVVEAGGVEAPTVPSMALRVALAGARQASLPQLQ